MSGLKQLAKETAIYGLSSILGKFLNWCLVPLYSYILTDSAEYGIITNLYAWTALIIIILTYGMETGFFRFAGRDHSDQDTTRRVYSTTLASIAFTSAIFIALITTFSHPIASAMGYQAHAEYIAILGIVVAIDAFDSIPFSYLRYKQRPILFASIKLLMIFVNIFFNIFFLIICPRIWQSSPHLISWFYDPNYGVGYIIIANLISTIAATIALIPQFAFKWTPDLALLRRMLRYSLPLLLLGIAGIMNQTIDKILFPIIYPDTEQAMSQLGIYGACFKIAMVMMMFTHAFRFAYEPYIFAKNGTRDSRQNYADAMKYYIITALLIFLLITFYLDIFQYILGSQYRVGLSIIPIVLITYLIQGIVYNLSLWYKLIDKTYFGSIFSVIGLIITLVINIIFIPIYSYWACAIASLTSYIVMAILSYAIGQRYYPISYPLRSIAAYTILAIILFTIAYLVPIANIILRLSFRTILLAVFITYTIKKDLPLSSIPILNRLTKKTKENTCSRQ